jgi:hypothetical protein
VEWTVSVDSTITRVHQHGATLARDTGGWIELQEFLLIASAISSRLTTRSVAPRRCDLQDPPRHRRQGQAAGLLLTGGNAADTSFFTTVLDTISVRDGRPGRPRTRPDRVLADKAYTSAANRRFLTDRGIKVTIPEREDQKAGRARRGSSRRTASHLRRRGLQGPQRGRTLLQQAQAMARHRHPLRQDRPLLPRRAHPRRALIWTR